MKLVIDIDCPRWMKTVAKLGLPMLTVCVVGIAVAAPLKTFSPGQTLAAADLNANFEELEAEIAALNHPQSAFRAYRNAPLSVADDTTQKVIFDTTIFDESDEYDPTTGTFTAKSAGTYLIQCGFLFFSVGSNLYGATISKNGVEIDSGTTWSAGANANTNVKPTVSQIEQLKPGDVVQCSVYQHAGATQSLLIFDARNSFSIARVD